MDTSKDLSLLGYNLSDDQLNRIIVKSCKDVRNDVSSIMENDEHILHYKAAKKVKEALAGLGIEPEILDEEKLMKAVAVSYTELKDKLDSASSREMENAGEYKKMSELPLEPATQEKLNDAAQKESEVASITQEAIDLAAEEEQRARERQGKAGKISAKSNEREVYHGVKYEIYHSIPNGYYAKGLGVAANEIAMVYFNSLEDAKIHAEMELQGWIDERAEISEVGASKRTAASKRAAFKGSFSTAQQSSKRKATGEPDQDYDHEYYDAIVAQLRAKGFNASHREFDKYQGVYIKVDGVDKFWIIESFIESGHDVLVVNPENHTDVELLISDEDAKALIDYCQKVRKENFKSRGSIRTAAVPKVKYVQKPDGTRVSEEAELKRILTDPRLPDNKIVTEVGGKENSGMIADMTGKTVMIGKEKVTIASKRKADIMEGSVSLKKIRNILNEIIRLAEVVEQRPGSNFEPYGKAIRRLSEEGMEELNKGQHTASKRKVTEDDFDTWFDKNIHDLEYEWAHFRIGREEHPFLKDSEDPKSLVEYARWQWSGSSKKAASDDFYNLDVHNVWDRKEIVEEILDDFKKITGVEIHEVFSKEQEGFEGEIFDDKVIDSTNQSIKDYVTDKYGNWDDEIFYELDEALTKEFEKLGSKKTAAFDPEEVPPTPCPKCHKKVTELDKTTGKCQYCVAEEEYKSKKDDAESKRNKRGKPAVKEIKLESSRRTAKKQQDMTEDEIFDRLDVLESKDRNPENKDEDNAEIARLKKELSKRGVNSKLYGSKRTASAQDEFSLMIQDMEGEYEPGEMPGKFPVDSEKTYKKYDKVINILKKHLGYSFKWDDYVSTGGGRSTDMNLLDAIKEKGVNVENVVADLKKANLISASKKVARNVEEYLSFEELTKDVKDAFYKYTKSDEFVKLVKNEIDSDIEASSVKEGIDGAIFDEECVSREVLKERGIYDITFSFYVSSDTLDYTVRGIVFISAGNMKPSQNTSLSIAESYPKRTFKEASKKTAGEGITKKTEAKEFIGQKVKYRGGTKESGGASAVNRRFEDSFMRALMMMAQAKESGEIEGPVDEDMVMEFIMDYPCANITDEERVWAKNEVLRQFGKQASKKTARKTETFNGDEIVVGGETEDLPFGTYRKGYDIVVDQKTGNYRVEVWNGSLRIYKGEEYDSTEEAQSMGMRNFKKSKPDLYRNVTSAKKTASSGDLYQKYYKMGYETAKGSGWMALDDETQRELEVIPIEDLQIDKAYEFADGWVETNQWYHEVGKYIDKDVNKGGEAWTEDEMEEQMELRTAWVEGYTDAVLVLLGK